MVLPGRIELPTSALPRMRSTTELRQHDHSNHSGGFGNPASSGVARAGARYCCGSGLCQACVGVGLELRGARGHDSAMAPPEKSLSREERLAAKLRENLRRRKAQARALGNDGKPALPKVDLKS